MLDPRTKLLLASAYGTLVALSRNQGWLLAEWGALVIAIIAMGHSKVYLRWLVMLMPMALFFGGVTWWSTDRETGQAAAMGLMAITTVFFCSLRAQIRKISETALSMPDCRLQRLSS
jgi:energy-coupling factor transport system permease protein